MLTWQHPDLENDISFRIIFSRNEKYIRWLLRNETHLNMLYDRSSLHCDRSHVRCIEHIWLWASNCLSSLHVWPWPSRLFPLHISDPEHAIVFFYFTCSTMDNRSSFFTAHVWLWSYQQFFFIIISAPERLFLFRMSDHESPVIFFYCTCLIMTVFFYCLYTF